MPDKHEVGGSSPLGPTKQANACNEIFDCVKSEIRKRMKFFDKSKSEIFATRKLKKRRKLQPFNYGGVAQLGEHLPCKQGVMGSNPIISTSNLKVTQNVH